METLQKTSSKQTWSPSSGCGRELIANRLKEYLFFDSFIFRKLIALLGLAAGTVLSVCGQPARALRIFSKVHRSAYSEWMSTAVERWVKRRMQKDRPPAQSFTAFCDRYVEALSSTPATAKFHEDPTRLLGTRVLVLKSPAVNEKGVVLIDYTFALSLFAKHFDVARIAQQYHLVLEPSWSGYCDPDILWYAKFDFPIFVQAPEPRDAAFLQNLARNFICLPLGDNCWVDHRIFKPLSGAMKNVDVVMIGSWGRYKRHYKFFSALARLRARGEKLKALLVGYRSDYTLDDILRQARHYDVEDQLEIYERLPPTEVNRQLNRAKVNLVWSRREGCNRASIEGMFAGVPCILRQGFNYGHSYPHINAQTGVFSSERDLPERISWVTRNSQRFSPRNWVLRYMTCQRATKILNESIRKVATASGENWTRDLAVKVTHVDAMRYWDDDERRRFETDFAFLRSTIRI